METELGKYSVVTMWDIKKTVINAKSLETQMRLTGLCV